MFQLIFIFHNIDRSPPPHPPPYKSIFIKCHYCRLSIMTEWVS
jgi:hypothetical protein